MKRARIHMKKEPQYLKDITYAIDSSPWIQENNLFSSDLFLGRFSEKQIMELFDKVGILSTLHKSGYKDLIINISRQEDFTSRLFVNFDSVSKDTRLIELIVKEGIFKSTQNFIEDNDFTSGISVLMIEWLALQNPKAQFSVERPRLPEQIYPGLGCLVNIQDMLYHFAKSGNKDAIVDVPQHYHGAVIYSRMYSFFSPIDGGRFAAMVRDFKGSPLADVSFAMASGCMKDEVTGELLYWKPSEQMYPISQKLKKYLASDGYQNLLADTARTCRFSIDWEKYADFKRKELVDEI